MCFSLYFLHHHTSRIVGKGIVINGWGAFDLVPLVANIFSVVVGLMVDDIKTTLEY